MNYHDGDVYDRRITFMTQVCLQLDNRIQNLEDLPRQVENQQRRIENLEDENKNLRELVDTLVAELRHNRSVRFFPSVTEIYANQGLPSSTQIPSNDSREVDSSRSNNSTGETFHNTEDEILHGLVNSSRISKDPRKRDVLRTIRRNGKQGPARSWKLKNRLLKSRKRKLIDALFGEYCHRITSMQAVRDTSKGSLCWDVIKHVFRNEPQSEQTHRELTKFLARALGDRRHPWRSRINAAIEANQKAQAQKK